MAAGALTDRYAANLHGVLSCYDRIIVTGTLPGACYAGGMTSLLYSRGVRIFDYPRFAEPLRDRIRERAQQVCEAAGVQNEHVNKSHIRKEELVARVLAVRGDAVGLVHLISAIAGVPELQAVARQDQRQDLPSSGAGQMPALLLLRVSVRVTREVSGLGQYCSDT